MDFDICSYVGRVRGGDSYAVDIGREGDSSGVTKMANLGTSKVPW